MLVVLDAGLKLLYRHLLALLRYILSVSVGLSSVKIYFVLFNLAQLRKITLIDHVAVLLLCLSVGGRVLHLNKGVTHIGDTLLDLEVIL